MEQWCGYDSPQSHIMSISSASNRLTDAEGVINVKVHSPLRGLFRGKGALIWPGHFPAYWNRHTTMSTTIWG